MMVHACRKNGSTHVVHWDLTAAVKTIPTAMCTLGMLTVYIVRDHVQYPRIPTAPNLRKTKCLETPGSKNKKVDEYVDLSMQIHELIKQKQIVTNCH